MATENIFVSDAVRQSAAKWPDRIALQDDSGATRLTYGELWAAVERGAAALRLPQRGLAPGDRVLLAASSSPAWMTSFLSIIHAGLVAVPIPASTDAGLIRLLVMFAGIRLVIGDRTGGDVHDAAGDVPFATAADLAADKPFDAVEPRDAAATAVLLFTSGSTTRPRAVALSHAALRANLRSLHALRQADPDEAMLSTLPTSHAYELVAGQLAPLAAGARVVYAGAPLPNRLVETIRTQRITRMIVVPALLDALVREVIDQLVSTGAAAEECRTARAPDLRSRIQALTESDRAQLVERVRARIGSHFRTAIVGGAAIDHAWTDVLSAIGVDLDVGYGLTEAGPVVAMGRASESPSGSVGRALPGVQIRIAADEEVLVKTDARMQGYAGDPSGTAEALTDDWLRTGDRGRLDADGFLFITGRIKEAMVTSAGETIYPDEIEPWYVSPLFAEFAVVPVSGEDGNDRPTLVVVPTESAAIDGAVGRAVATMRAAAPARLRVSGFVVRTTPLPRTAVGKIRRRALALEVEPGEVAT